MVSSLVKQWLGEMYIIHDYLHVVSGYGWGYQVRHVCGNCDTEQQSGIRQGMVEEERYADRSDHRRWRMSDRERGHRDHAHRSQ
jgi:hypothetical protein